MYIVKNALKCLGRAKGRNVLIGIIVLIIAVAACVGLSIRQASEQAKEETLENLSVTATISFDRQSMMNDMRDNMKPPTDGGEFNSKDFANQFSETMGSSSTLSLEDYQKYAKASTVDGFYYTLSSSLNGSDDFQPVSTETEDKTEDSDSSNAGPNGFGGQPMPNMFGVGFGGRTNFSQSDFSLTGYSAYEAITFLYADTATGEVTDGNCFDVTSDAAECIISEELAIFNDIAVGDTITLTNPSNEEETYTLTVCGIYTDSAANENSFSGMGLTFSDPANSIYLSTSALQTILDASEENAVTETDEETGRESTTALQNELKATYVFKDVERYETFAEEVYTLGLAEDYTVESSDLAAYENSLTPLKTLSTMATWSLLVILIIGAAILIVLNIFNVRERKYEIGVLTAMGMKKGKVALQFLTEIFVVTIIAVMLGVIIGGVSAVPVTNALLENQSLATQSNSDRLEQNFGRGDIGSFGSFGGFGGGFGGGAPEQPEPPEDLGGFDGFMNDAGNYITEINSAMNLTVVFQMLGIAVLLTLVAGAFSMVFVMRYEPLKILANRD